MMVMTMMMMMMMMTTSSSSSSSSSSSPSSSRTLASCAKRHAASLVFTGTVSDSVPRTSECWDMANASSFFCSVFSLLAVPKTLVFAVFSNMITPIRTTSADRSIPVYSGSGTSLKIFKHIYHRAQTQVEHRRETHVSMPPPFVLRVSWC